MFVLAVHLTELCCPLRIEDVSMDIQYIPDVALYFAVYRNNYCLPKERVM